MSCEDVCTHHLAASVRIDKRFTIKVGDKDSRYHISPPLCLGAFYLPLNHPERGYCHLDVTGGAN